MIHAGLALNRSMILCKQHGLNWQVKKQLLNFDLTEEVEDKAVTKTYPSGFYGLVRKDTKECFATCKDDYSVMQNYELGALVVQIAASLKLEIKTANFFNGGRVVYFKVFDKEFQVGTDKLEKYIVAFSGHDAKHSLSWGSMYRFKKDSTWFSTTFVNQKTRHTKSMKARVNEAISTLDKTREEEALMIEKFITMSKTKASLETVREIVKSVTGVDMALEESVAKSMYSTRKLNQAKTLNDAMMEQIRTGNKTLWSCWNGVVKYTQDNMSLNRDNGEMESKMIGRAYANDNKVLQQILKMVK